MVLGADIDFAVSLEIVFSFSKVFPDSLTFYSKLNPYNY